jgi:hypothetical protein
MLGYSLLAKRLSAFKICDRWGQSVTEHVSELLGTFYHIIAITTSGSSYFSRLHSPPSRQLGPIRGSRPTGWQQHEWSSNVSNCIREALVSNLGRNTNNPDWCTSQLSQVPAGKIPKWIIEVGYDCFLPYPFQFSIHYHPVIGRYILSRIYGRDHFWHQS